MKLSTGLLQKRTQLVERMEALSGGAKDRLLDADEQQEWDRLGAEVEALDRQLAREEAREAMVRGDTTARPITPGGPRLIDENGNPVRTLRFDERISDLEPHRAVAGEPMPSLGRFVRAAATGDWRGLRPVERAIGIGGDQVFPVPTPLSTTWWDNVRAASVALRSGARTVPMTSDTLKMIRVDQDPVVTWRKEHRPIPESDIVFGNVTLNAKLGGIICRLSVEVVEDSNPAAEAVVEQVMTSTMALAIDQAMLSADGSQAGDLDNMLGLLNDPDILVQAGASPMVNYDPVIQAMGQVWANNITPGAFIANPGFMVSAGTTKTGLAGDQTVLMTPEPFFSLPKFYTTSMPADTAVLGDFTFMLLGLRTGMTLEATRVGGDGTFSRAQYLVRLYTRADTARVRSKAFCKITGLAT